MYDYYPILRTCSFFDGVPEDKYPSLLRCLKATPRAFQKGSSILDIGEHSQTAGLVLGGTVEISLLDENGNQINVNHISRGDVFGAELSCSHQETSPIRLQAITDCEVLFLDFGALMNTTEPLCPYRARVAANLLQNFAQQTLFLNQRLRIMGQKRLRDKIKVYLQNQHTQPDGTIRIPFKRNALADYLYADRSALSRELGRMRNEGILACRGQVVRVLDPAFLK